MTKLDKYLEETKEQLEELNDEEKKLFHKKADFSIKSVGLMYQEFKDSINQLFEGLAGSELFDKKTRGDLHDTIMKSINAFAEAKHEINFAPVINIDTTPLQKIISDTLSDNKLIYDSIKKMGNSGWKSEEYNMILDMVGKYTAKLEDIKNNDNNIQLEAINKTLSSKPLEWEIEVTKRDELRGYIEKATIKAK